MQQAVTEIETERSTRPVYLTWLAQINRYFQLGESLRETASRRWWDLLAFRLAIEQELEMTRQSGRDPVV